MKYKNIVFDVGHVLLSYNWLGMMMDHGFSETEAKQFAAMLFDDPLWDQFDLENWSYEEVVAKYIWKHPDRADDIRYFFFHKELMPVARPGVYEQIRKLHEKGLRLHILSNYSSVLFECHMKKVPVFNLIDCVMLSAYIHIGKPDPRIYQALFEKAGILPEESLFFDDRPENVEASQKMGMDAIQVISEQQLEGELSKLVQQG